MIRSFALVAFAVAGFAAGGCASAAGSNECDITAASSLDACANPRSAEECEKGIAVNVSEGTAPRIDWTPRCAINHLVVASVGRGGQEGILVWSFTAPESTPVRPSVRYGELPAGAILEGPLRPLVIGGIYRITVEKITGGTVITGQGATTFIP